MCTLALVDLYSDNIRVVSIIGRFLEHHRVMRFENGELMLFVQQFRSNCRYGDAVFANKSIWSQPLWKSFLAARLSVSVFHISNVYFLCLAGGKAEYYMGSADWMNRNLTRRVEVVVPVEAEPLQKELQVKYTTITYCLASLANPLKAAQVFIQSWLFYSKVI